MITKTVGFQVGNEFFPTIAAAQTHAITKLLEDGKCQALQPPQREGIAEFLVTQRDNLLDILTTTASSKPSARKINGGTKRRRPSIPSPQTARALNSEKAE